MKLLKTIAYLVLALCFALPASAQHRIEVDDIPVDFSLQLKNAHLWRGLQVTNEAMAGVDLNVKSKNEHFTLGLWGGAGFTGKFKEFDYYASFQHSGFKIAVWDIYNFSKDVAHNNTQLFNYNARETGHFVDLSIGYTFQGKFPLSINWATVIFGRDRGALNNKNLYTSYVSLDYPLLKVKLVNIDVGMAGAFALDKESGSKAHFYGKRPGIVNVNLTASKDIKLGSYTLPVSVMGMWNPVNNDGHIQVALTVF